MYGQCNAAQNMLNAHHLKMGLPMQTFGCYDHIVCNPPLPPRNGKSWCQNMDSYDVCVTIRNIIENANATAEYPVECNFAVMLTDNVRVLNYRRPAKITTTTTTTTTTPVPTTTTFWNTTGSNITTTIAEETTAPASATQVIHSLSIMMFVLLFIGFL